MKACRLPRTGVVLTVGAKKVALPPKMEVPPAQSDVYTVADAYGRIVQTFGTVTVLAPPTMAVLNTHPPPVNVSANLRAFEAFPMLLAALNDAQWAMLTSDTGIGLADLDTDTERNLFHALFQRGLKIASSDPALQTLDDDKRPDVQDVSDQTDNARIRLGQTAHFYLHDTHGETIFYSAPAPDAKSHLTVFRPRNTPPRQTAYSVPVRAVVPNVPKDSDLDFRLPALQNAISLDKLATVGALIDRVRAQTHVEIYADPHYAARIVTVIGPAVSAPARDLLQAVALCVCGTYRKVGPAFVLTDDVQGVGARRETLKQWNEASLAGSRALKDAASAALLARRASAARSLSGFGEPLGLTPAQMKALPPDTLMPEVPGGDDYTVRIQDLTPAQQEWARAKADAFNAARNADPPAPYFDADDKARVPDLSGSVDFRANTLVQVLLPSLPAPVDTEWGYGPLSLLYYPGEENLSARLPAAYAAYSKKHPEPPPPPLGSLLKTGKRRALVAHPRTAADVDALLPAMHKLGLNELYVDVFSDGEAHVPGSALSPHAPIAGNDILTEALARAPKLGIAVCADLSLLLWGDAPPAAAADLSILGETSAEAAVHAHQRDPSPQFDDDTGKLIPFVPPPVQVSPLAPAVQNALTALVASLSARPGLAGFVWEDADMDDTLGYTDAQRLLFLRAAHADPTDITPQNQYLPFDVSLPEWDNDAAEGKLSAQWDDARQQSCDGLLGRLERCVPPSLPILRPAEDDNGRYFAASRAGRQGPPVLLSAHADHPDKLAAQMQKERKVRPGAGYVLDFTDKDATRGPSPLSDLLAAVHTPPTDAGASARH